MLVIHLCGNQCYIQYCRYRFNHKHMAEIKYYKYRILHAKTLTSYNLFQTLLPELPGLPPVPKSPWG